MENDNYCLWALFKTLNSILSDHVYKQNITF